MHLIEFSKEASKVLARMPRDLRDLRDLLMRKIEVVAADPYGAHGDVKRLQGRPEFRLRVHDWRVVYRVLDDRVALLVIKIGVRGQVYE